MESPAGREQLKIAVGVLLMFSGSLLAIRGFPSPTPVVLASARDAAMPLMPGQGIVQVGLPWEVFVSYFKLLLLSLLLVNAGGILLYAGLTERPGPGLPIGRDP